VQGINVRPRELYLEHEEGWMVNHPGYESFSIELTKPEVPSTMIRWTTYAQNDVDGMNNG